jgi:hypothetical protein
VEGSRRRTEEVDRTDLNSNLHRRNNGCLLVVPPLKIARSYALSHSLVANNSYRIATAMEEWEAVDTLGEESNLHTRY